MNTTHDTTQSRTASELWIDPKKLRSLLECKIDQAEVDLRYVLAELSDYSRCRAVETDETRVRRREQLEGIDELWSRVLSRLRVRLKDL